MALSHPVMLRNCQHLSEARYAAGMEVNYVGFVFRTDDSDERRHTITAIWNWLAGVSLVAEIYEANQEMVAEVRANYNPTLWLVTPSVVPLLEAADQYVLMVEDADADIQDERCIGRAVHEEDIHNLDPTALPLWVELTDATQLDYVMEKAAVVLIPGQPEERPGFPDLSLAIDVLEALEVEL